MKNNKSGNREPRLAVYDETGRADARDGAAIAEKRGRKSKREDGSRAIDGALFVVDIGNFSRPERAPASGIAAGFRALADALVLETGYRVPVYFAFSNCENIPGFKEALACEKTAGTPPPAGALVDAGNVRGAEADSAQAGAVRAFGYHYQNIRSRLSGGCLSELITAEASGKSAALCRLPAELVLMEAPLTAFIEEFFVDNGAIAPRFGGFFFIPAADARQQLSGVIPAARFGVRDAVYRRRLKKIRRRASLAALWLAAMLIIPGGAVRDARYLRSVHAELSGIFASPQTIESQYAALDKLRLSYYGLSGGLRHPWRLIFRTGGVRGKIRDVYIAASREIMLAPAASRIEARIRRETESGGEMTAEEHLSLYRTLETYLILTGENPPKAAVDVDAVAEIFERNLKNSLGGRYQKLDGKIVAANISAVINFAAAGYYGRSGRSSQQPSGQPPPSRPAPDDGLIAAAREKLARAPRAGTVYRAVMDKLHVPPRAVPVSRLTGRGANLRYGREVSALYTRDGWEQTVLPAFIGASKNPFNNDWIMGPVVINMDGKKLLSDLAALYAKDLTERWLGFIGNTAVNMPSDLPALAHDLEKLSSRESETGRMLAVVCSLAAQPPDGIGQADAPMSVKGVKERVAGAADKLRGAVYGLAYDVPDPFAEARKTFGAIDTFLTAGAFEEYRQCLGGLAASVRECGERGGCAAAFASREDTPLSRCRQTLAALYKNLPNAVAAELKRVLEPPVEQAAPALAKAAAAELDESWRAEVVSFYNERLAGRYPFDGSGADASWGDVEEFFNPRSGALRVYIDKNLSGLIERAPGGRASAPRRLSIPLSISGEATAAISRAENIANAFFTNDGAPRRLDITFQPLASGSGEARLFIGDKQLDFRGGSPVTIVRQPPAFGGEPVVLRLSTVERAQEELRFSGDWSLMRFFGAGRTERRGGGRYGVRWSVSVRNAYTAQVTTAIQTNADALLDESVTRGFKLPEKIARR